MALFMKAHYRTGLVKKDTKSTELDLTSFDLLFICLIAFFFLSFLNITIPIYKSAFINLKTFQKRVFFNNPSTFDIPILLYHYVEYVKDPGDTIRKSLSIEPLIFEQQVKSLKDANYVFLTPKNLADISENKIAIPDKPVILTFDDGYKDFYTDVFPILKKYNVKAVAYIISGFLDTPNYMTSEELKEIAKSNLVEVACHTVDHPNLKTLSDTDAAAEIRGCYEDLYNKFGIKPVSFAYPYGEYREGLFPLVKEAGFTNAVTTVNGMQVNKDLLFSIPRVRPGNRIGQELITFLLKENFISINSGAPAVKLQ